MTLYLIVLIILAALFILIPVWRFQMEGKVSQGELRKQKNIEIFQQTKAELEQSYEDKQLEQHEYEKIKLELEKNFLADMESEDSAAIKQKYTYTKLIPLLLVLLIPVFSVLLYRSLGSAQDLVLPELISELNSAQSQEEQLASLNEIAVVLESRFQRRGDLQSGFSLGTLYLGLDDFSSAARIFSQLADIAPDDASRAEILGQLAQAQYLGADSSMTPAVQASIDAALALNSNQPSVMSILAIEAFLAENYAQAINYWRRQISQLPPGSNEIRAINQRIGMLEQILARDSVADTEAAENTEARVQIRVDVSIDESIRDQIPEGMRVFVFARGVDMPVPLAAQTYTVEELPLSVTLDDSMAMTPQFTLSSASSVYVGARISRQATPESGDFEAVSEAFEISEQTEPVQLLIKDIIP